MQILIVYDRSYLHTDLINFIDDSLKREGYGVIQFTPSTNSDIAYDEVKDYSKRYNPNLVISFGTAGYYSRLIGGPKKILMDFPSECPADSKLLALDEYYERISDLEFSDETYSISNTRSDFKFIKASHQYVCKFGVPYDESEIRSLMIPTINEIINSDEGATYSEMMTI